MRKIKLLAPLTIGATIAATTIPLASCGESHELTANDFGVATVKAKLSKTPKGKVLVSLGHENGTDFDIDVPNNEVSASGRQVTADLIVRNRVTSGSTELKVAFDYTDTDGNAIRDVWNNTTVKYDSGYWDITNGYTPKINAHADYSLKTTEAVEWYYKQQDANQNAEYYKDDFAYTAADTIQAWKDAGKLKLNSCEFNVQNLYIDSNERKTDFNIHCKADISELTYNSQYQTNETHTIVVSNLKIDEINGIIDDGQLDTVYTPTQTGKYWKFDLKQDEGVEIHGNIWGSCDVKIDEGATKHITWNGDEWSTGSYAEVKDEIPWVVIAILIGSDPAKENLGQGAHLLSPYMKNVSVDSE